MLSLCVCGVCSLCACVVVRLCMSRQVELEFISLCLRVCVCVLSRMVIVILREKYSKIWHKVRSCMYTRRWCLEMSRWHFILFHRISCIRNFQSLIPLIIINIYMIGGFFVSWSRWLQCRLKHHAGRYEIVDGIAIQKPTEKSDIKVIYTSCEYCNSRTRMSIIPMNQTPNKSRTTKEYHPKLLGLTTEQKKRQIFTFRVRTDMQCMYLCTLF